MPHDITGFIDPDIVQPSSRVTCEGGKRGRLTRRDERKRRNGWREGREEIRWGRREK